jgi:hypothetical protein
LRPAETDAPLIVDADAVVPFPVTGQRFEMVSRWGLQKFERGRRLELSELASRYLDNRIEALRLPGFKEFPGVWAPEAFDHREII